MIEMIDVLDENGVKTGEVATRTEVHQRGLWHRIVAIMIVDEKKRILLQQRSNDRITNPGKWDIAAAGHVDAREDALLTVMREAKEEVGVEISDKCSAEDFRYVTCYREEKSFEHNGEDFIDKQFNDCFLLKNQKIDLANVRLQESEVQAVKFCSLEEFKQMMRDGVLVNRKPFYDDILKILD